MLRLPAGQRADIGYVALDLDGQPKTGLVVGDFTVALLYESVRDSGSYAAGVESVTLAESDAGDAPGVYEFRFTPLLAKKYILSITPLWANAAAGLTQIQLDFIEPSIGATDKYASVDQVKALVGGYGAGDTDDDALIESLLEHATAEIDAYTNRSFFSAAHTEYPRGGGGEKLTLKHYPITAITSVHVSEDAPRAYTADELLVEGTDYFVDEDAGLLELASGNWPSGTKTIRVIYTAGPTTIPLVVNRACYTLAAYWLRTRRFLGTQSVNNPDGSVTVASESSMPWAVRDILTRLRVPVV